MVPHLIFSYLKVARSGGPPSQGKFATTLIHSLSVSTNRPGVSALIHYLWVCPPITQVSVLGFVPTSCPSLWLYFGV